MTILLAHRKEKTEVNFSGRQQKIIFRLFRMYKSQTKGNIHISVFPIQSECCHTRLSHDSSSEPVGRKMLRKCHYLIYLCTPALWFQASFSVPDCCCYYKSTLDHRKINIPHIWIMDFSVCLIQKEKKKISLLLLLPISPSNRAGQLTKNLVVPWPLPRALQAISRITWRTQHPKHKAYPWGQSTGQDSLTDLQVSEA